MAGEDKRAVAPGTQIVKANAVKGKSWVDVSRKGGVIGQIFFATDSSTLDSNDMAELQKIVDAYPSRLNVKRIVFEIYGYADYRYTKDHNYTLSQQRATAVAGFIGDSARLGAYSNYVPDVRGIGVDYRGVNRPPDSVELAPYRRVDIMAEPITPQPQSTPTPPSATGTTSTQWAARIYRAGSAGYGVAAFESFEVEILDLTNNRALSFKYEGIGVGISIRGTPGISTGTSVWKTFSTIGGVDIKEFEGGARHVAGQAQVGVGPSTDWLTLLGPSARHPASVPPVKLVFEGFSSFEIAIGVGALTTIGGISPDPPAQEPYYPPRLEYP